MKIDLLTLAEGAVIDGRGALALVGVNQRVLSPLTTPFYIKQRLVIMFSDESRESPELEFGEIPNGEVSVRVINPSGSATFAKSEELKSPPAKQWLDLPQLLNLIMDVDIRGDAYGIYNVEVTYKSSDFEDEETYRFPVYIVTPQTALHPEKPPRKVFSS